MLGALEQKIMETLWSSPVPLKPSEVLAQIDGGQAYTTVMTVLKRMADKKIVIRKMKNRVYYYQAAQDKCSFASEALDDLFRRLFSSYGGYTVTAFKKIAKKSGFSL
ncbi:MAG: Transcriptional repressor, CopY family [Candidatus Shapirobacteria bacterium GW2011_GWF2_37_20]|nr:MAG: Transcriptional repressor, CopY family [Candidatus Shapirobacteria bacterium GW2011_GWF2_37_20]